MATYVNDLRLTELATGEGSGTWGVTTNTNLELIGEALGYGTQDCFASDADATTTVADGATDPARAMYFKVTSSATLTATRTLTIAPNTMTRVMLIENATTGSQSIAISQGSGGNVTIANGAVKMVYLDGAGAGAAVVDALADLELGTITVANLTATTADINGGTIDGATIGGASAAAGTFTTLNATGGGSLTGTWSDLGTVTTVDINGGTIDGTDITVGSGKTLDVSAGTFTVANDQISGDAIDGGTATPTTLTSTTVNATTVDTTNIEVTNLKAKDGTVAGSIADSTGVVTLSSSVLTTTDINGGTIDGVTIGGASAGAGTFTNLTATGTTTLAGASTSADITFGDNDKAIFGAGSDLEIYHNGSNSFITDVGTGNLYLRAANNIFVQGATDNDALATFQEDGFVKLYFDNAEKLATTNTGINVTGTVTADGLTVEGTNGNFEVAATGNSVNMTRAGNNFITASDAVGDLFLGAGGVSFVKIDNGGDISFYDSAGSSQSLFWDASAEALGIGTTNPNRGILHLQGANYVLTNSGQALGGIHIDADTAPGAGGYTNGISFGYTAGASAIVGVTSDLSADADRQGLAFIVHESSTGGADAVEAMRLTSDGKLGIGTASPANKLHVEQSVDGDLLIEVENPNTGASSVAGLYLNGQGNNFFLKNYGDGTAKANITEFISTAATSQFVFSLNSTERARIDASGNLLVGRTTASTVNAGGRISADGFAGFTRDGDTTLLVNRLTSDGEIVRIQKDGTTVGSIGTLSGFPYMYGGTGFLLSSTALRPADSDGTNSDADTDLGSSSSRFKDLYLSGGVYLGGTGAANLLDDYEEGLHTATLTCGTSGTITLGNDALAYTKIGRVVHLQGRLIVTAVSSPTGTIALSLPFAIANTAEDSARTVGYLQIQNATSNLNEFGFYSTEGLSSIELAVTGGTTSENTAINAMAAEFSGNEYVTINLTYITT